MCRLIGTIILLKYYRRCWISVLKMQSVRRFNFAPYNLLSACQHVIHLKVPLNYLSGVALTPLKQNHILGVFEDFSLECKVPNSEPPEEGDGEVFGQNRIYTFL